MINGELHKVGFLEKMIDQAEQLNNGEQTIKAIKD